MIHRPLFIGVLLTMSSLIGPLVAAAQEPPQAGIWEAMRDIRPREYLCHYTAAPIVLDGRADEAAWQQVPWTEDFVDIEGSKRDLPRFRTRAKMLWDETYFYVHAELDEPHVWGTITEKNKVMFHDNDFEVFIDPDGDNHNYYEFEMNALNSVWELSLTRPYRDGGPTRDPDNLEGLKTAVHIRGTINDPSDTDEGWSVEIAFPWKALQKFAGSATCPPREQDIWRVGFSRVEWLIDIIHGKYHKIANNARREDNWIWSPQGIVDMHRPERWGFVQFTRKPVGEAVFVADPTLPAREALMEIYHRQRWFREKYERWATSLAELGLDQHAVEKPLLGPVEMVPNCEGFLATVRIQLPDGKTATLHTRQDSRLWRAEERP